MVGCSRSRYGMGCLPRTSLRPVACDVLTAAMLQLHRDAIAIVATIHDEIVALAPAEHAAQTLKHMLSTMSRPPVWAKDLPLAADGYVNRRFIKPSKGTTFPLMSRKTVVDQTSLLRALPIGEYLLEQRGEILMLWRIDEGELPEDAIRPAQTWPWRMEELTPR